ncbi:MAG: class I SAM-dependent methyltransferase [Prochlorococcaceae cyanobacterium]
MTDFGTTGSADAISTYPQVPASSYAFDRYMTPRRWSSFWHQASMIAALKPQQVLEVGVGNGLMKLLCGHMGISHTSVDLAADLSPDILASALALPVGDGSFDLTCAFQVLEHLPYQDSLLAFRELCRVSRRNILISLPNASPACPLMLTLPLLGSLRLLPQLPLPPLHRMIRSHHWEIGRPGTGLRRLTRDLSQSAKLIRCFRVFDHPYHQFFHFQRH